MYSRCYLAGPIRGQTFSESENWRDYVKSQMPDRIECFSPLRYKHFLKNVGIIAVGGIGHDTYDHEGPLASARGIMSRDHHDCSKADLVFCNFLNATEVSIGTTMEVAWAFAYRIPLIVCINKGNMHDHPMIREATNFECHSLDEGIHIAKSILLP